MNRSGHTKTKVGTIGLLKKLVKSVIERHGYRVIRYPVARFHSPRTSYPISPKLTERHDSYFARVAKREISSLWPQTDEAFDWSRSVESFFRYYTGRPFVENTGGSGFHNSFWLYLLCDVLKPQLIVESGVWRGQTTHLFRQVAPDAEIFGFDIDLAHLEVPPSTAHFIESDWNSFDFGAIDQERSLLFFDCHINQCRRVIEAHERGFKTLVFDDNPPLEFIHREGLPGFPTVAMAMAAPEREDIEYLFQGQKKEYVCNDQTLALMEDARKHIKTHHEFADVGTKSGYGGYSFLTLVELV